MYDKVECNDGELCNENGTYKTNVDLGKLS